MRGLQNDRRAPIFGVRQNDHHVLPDARAAKYATHPASPRLRGFYGGKSATLAAIVDLQEIFVQSPFFICFFEGNIVYYIGKSIARVAEWYGVSY